MVEGAGEQNPEELFNQLIQKKNLQEREKMSDKKRKFYGLLTNFSKQ